MEYRGFGNWREYSGYGSWRGDDQDQDQSGYADQGPGHGPPPGGPPARPSYGRGYGRPSHAYDGPGYGHDVHPPPHHYTQPRVPPHGYGGEPSHPLDAYDDYDMGGRYYDRGGFSERGAGNFIGDGGGYGRGYGRRGPPPTASLPSALRRSSPPPIPSPPPPDGVTLPRKEYFVELQNVPKFFGVSQAKRVFKRADVEYLKFVLCRPDSAEWVVSFRCEEERTRAVGILDGFVLKGSKIRAVRCKEPKANLRQKGNSSQRKTFAALSSPSTGGGGDTKSALEQIRSAVCPLSHLPYEEQLKIKLDLTRTFADDLRTQVLDLYRQVKDIGNPDLLKESSVAVLEEDVVASPEVFGYRNKCEFSVGYHPETKEITVGFQLPSFGKGTVAAVGIEEMPAVSRKMKRVVRHFQSHCRASGHLPFDNVTHRGLWKRLSLRTTEEGEVMAFVVLSPLWLTDAEKAEIKERLREHMVKDIDGLGDIEGEEEELRVTSLHVQFFERAQRGVPNAPIELLHGPPFLTERLMGVEYTITPLGFFQINKKGAELLYGLVGDLAAVDGETTLLEVCCGPGTVALGLAGRCQKVLGVEMKGQPVDDARRSAERNGIGNATFVSDKAEAILRETISLHHLTNLSTKSVIVTTPPKTGLHRRAIHSLRTTTSARLVYLISDGGSAEATAAAAANFVDLARPRDAGMPGEPFVPRRVVAVDLFPHTNLFDIVVLLERIDSDELMKTAMKSGDGVETETERDVSS